MYLLIPLHPMKIWVNINAMIPAIPVAVQLVRLFKNCSGVPLKSPGILNLSSLFLSQAPRMESDRQPANPEIPAIRIIPPGLSAEPARIDRPMRKEPASAAASPLLLTPPSSPGGTSFIVRISFVLPEFLWPISVAQVSELEAATAAMAAIKND